MFVCIEPSVVRSSATFVWVGLCLTAVSCWSSGASLALSCDSADSSFLAAFCSFGGSLLWVEESLLWTLLSDDCSPEIFACA